MDPYDTGRAGHGRSGSLEVSTEVGVALLTAATALAVSVVNYVTKKRSDLSMETLRDQLAGAREEDKARRDYEYDARKRLYAEFQPLLFQLCECCESAYFRIRDLSERARRDELEGWLRDEPYYLSTLHRLLTPLVVFRLCQRRLTFVDLTVEPRIRTQYALAKQLYLSWSGAFELARAQPSLEYNPYGEGPDPEAVHALQHIVIGDLDRLIDAMTIAEPDAPLRCMGYGEFEDRYRDPGSSLNRAVSKIGDLVANFHPQRRPVLWRVLVTQAHIHRALVRSLQAGLAGPTDTLAPTNALTRGEQRDLEWQARDAPSEAHTTLPEPFAAVHEYLGERFPSISGGGPT